MFIRVILSTVLILAFLSSFCFAVEVSCNYGGRYEDNGDGTVTDCKSGLVWLKNANCTATVNGIDKSSGYVNWINSRKWVAGLSDGLCGLTDGSSAGDWRLPANTELMAMVESAKAKGFKDPVLTDATGLSQATEGNIFTGVPAYFWSSTTRSDATQAWVLYMHDGLQDNASKSSDCCFGIWPVRGGQDGSFGSLLIQ
jgi:hypothetical protein